MKFQFSTSLTNVQVPGATVSIDKIDVSVSMEMEDEAYNGLIEMVYNRMAAMFGVPSTEKPEPEAPEASEGGYIVLCREDDKVGGTRGAYVPATSQRFASYYDAKRYADGIAYSRESFVVNLSNGLAP